MSRAGSAREALIAEALGELGVLLDRIEALRPLMEGACQQLTEQAFAAEERIAQTKESAAAEVLQRVEGRADELAARTSARHTRAMGIAARAIFRAELGAALQRLALAIDQRAKQGGRQQSWWWHALTALAVAAATWAVAVHAVGSCSA